MKRIKLLYNPNAGTGAFKDHLDEVIAALQNTYEVHLYRCHHPHDMEKMIACMKHDRYDAIAVSGGDGTINCAVNAMINNGIDLPLGIFQAGTANDFASFLGIPKDFGEAAEVISRGNTLLSDIGCVNGTYFINVCGMGLFANISQQIDPRLKPVFGKMAYYMKGLEQIPNFEAIPIRVTNSVETFEESVYLFIVLNTSGTGGFSSLSSKSSICDEKFEFIAVKAKPISEIAVLFFNILRNDYLTDSNIIHFQDGYIKVEQLSDDSPPIESDIDGEVGPVLPLEIMVAAEKINFFIQ